MSDLMELNGLDQSLPVDDTYILNRVEEVMRESIEMKDVYHALDFGKGLIQVSQLSGMALAKLFYLLRENWDIFEVGDEFHDVAFSYIGRDKNTVNRYIRVWEMYEHKMIPENLSEEIRQKNIKDQIPIAAMLSQGFEPDDEEWQELADAPDNSSVLKKVREIKGKEPRADALLIYFTSDGTLQAEQGDEIEFVGYLNIREAGDIAQKAIQRLLRSAGVLER